MVYMENLKGSKHGLNYQNINTVRGRCIDFNHIKYYFLARKHILQGECKYKDNRGDRDLYEVRHTRDTFIEGEGVGNQSCFESSC